MLKINRAKNETPIIVGPQPSGLRSKSKPSQTQTIFAGKSNAFWKPLKFLENSNHALLYTYSRNYV